MSEPPPPHLEYPEQEQDLFEILNHTPPHFTNMLRSGNIVNTEERRLTLAYEGLSYLPSYLLTDYGNIIEVLDLSYNSISNLEFLSHFPNLTTLILDHNSVSADSTFPPLSSLSTLWLNHNMVTNLHPFIPRLGLSCRNLRTLSLMGNEASPSYLNGGTYYQYLQARFFVISWLGNIQYLDDRKVTADQRKEARRLYGRKLIRSFKQSLTIHPENVMNRFRNLFSNAFRLGFRDSQNQNENNDNEGIFIGESEGIRVEEINIAGLHSDSDSSSLNRSGNTFDFNPDPSIRTKQKNKMMVGKNLVI